jgi:hypothetical protein
VRGIGRSSGLIEQQPYTPQDSDFNDYELEDEDDSDLYLATARLLRRTKEVLYSIYPFLHTIY